MPEWSEQDQFNEDLVELLEKFKYALTPNEMCETLVTTATSIMIYITPTTIGKLQLLDWINSIYELIQ